MFNKFKISKKEECPCGSKKKIWGMLLFKRE